MTTSRSALLLGLTLAVTAACGADDSGEPTGDEPIGSAPSTPHDSDSTGPDGASTAEATVLPGDSAAPDATDADQADEPVSDSPAGAVELPFGLVRCPTDFSPIAADPSYYRDEPVYVGNEMPTEQVREWAETQPNFEELWIDRDHNGWVAVGFTEGAAERQADIEELFPGEGVVAVDVEVGRDELDRLRDEAVAVFEAEGINGAAGGSVATGYVSVNVGVLDEDTLRPFADFAGQPVCFEGAETEDAVADGPQPESGDGWRLLTVERTGHTYRTGVATDEEQYVALWETAGVTGERPTVDFEHEIVIWFGAVYGSGCPIRMDDVVVDHERSLVHGDFVVPGNPAACNDNANPEAYLVAVARDHLPEGPFGVQLGADAPPSGVPEERTDVTVGLTEPGSTATADQLVAGERAEPSTEDDAVGPGGIVEADFPGAVYRLEPGCPVDVVGPLNGVIWVADNDALAATPPAPWLESVRGDDEAMYLEILLETATDDHGPRLTLSANGHAETYSPAPPDVTAECG